MSIVGCNTRTSELRLSLDSEYWVMVRASFERTNVDGQRALRVVVIRWWSVGSWVGSINTRLSVTIRRTSPIWHRRYYYSPCLFSLHSSPPPRHASRYHDCGWAMYGLHGLASVRVRRHGSIQRGLQGWSSPVGHVVMPTSSTARLYRSWRSKDAADWALPPVVDVSSHRRPFSSLPPLQFHAEPVAA